MRLLGAGAVAQRADEINKRENEEENVDRASERRCSFGPKLPEQHDAVQDDQDDDEDT